MRDFFVPTSEIHEKTFHGEPLYYKAGQPRKLESEAMRMLTVIVRDDPGIFEAQLQVVRVNIQDHQILLRRDTQTRVS